MKERPILFSAPMVRALLADPSSAMHRSMPPRHMLPIAHQLPGLLARRRTAARAARKAAQ